MFPDHPPPGQAHPWNDPLVPGDPFRPRPDWALQQLGPVPPPRPEDFPFTDAGRSAYYQAVEQAAMQNTMQQQQMAYAAMHQQQMTSAAQSEAQTAFQRRSSLLLLL